MVVKFDGWVVSSVKVTANSSFTRRRPQKAFSKAIYWFDMSSLSLRSTSHHTDNVLPKAEPLYTSSAALFSISLKQGGGTTTFQHHPRPITSFWILLHPHTAGAVSRATWWIPNTYSKRPSPDVKTPLSSNPFIDLQRPISLLSADSRGDYWSRNTWLI